MRLRILSVALGCMFFLPMHTWAGQGADVPTADLQAQAPKKLAPQTDPAHLSRTADLTSPRMRQSSLPFMMAGYEITVTHSERLQMDESLFALFMQDRIAAAQAALQIQAGPLQGRREVSDAEKQGFIRKIQALASELASASSAYLDQTLDDTEDPETRAMISSFLEVNNLLENSVIHGTGPKIEFGKIEGQRSGDGKTVAIAGHYDRKENKIVLNEDLLAAPTSSPEEDNLRLIVLTDVLLHEFFHAVANGPEYVSEVANSARQAADLAAPYAQQTMMNELQAKAYGYYLTGLAVSREGSAFAEMTTRLLSPNPSRSRPSTEEFKWGYLNENANYYPFSQIKVMCVGAQCGTRDGIIRVELVDTCAGGASEACVGGLLTLMGSLSDFRMNGLQPPKANGALAPGEDPYAALRKETSSMRNNIEPDTGKPNASGSGNADVKPSDGNPAAAKPDASAREGGRAAAGRGAGERGGKPQSPGEAMNQRRENASRESKADNAERSSERSSKAEARSAGRAGPRQAEAGGRSSSGSGGAAESADRRANERSAQSEDRRENVKDPADRSPRSGLPDRTGSARGAAEEARGASSEASPANPQGPAHGAATPADRSGQNPPSNARNAPANAPAAPAPNVSPSNNSSEGAHVWRSTNGVTNNKDGSTTYDGYEEFPDGTMREMDVTCSGNSCRDQRGRSFTPMHSDGTPMTAEECRGNCAPQDGTALVPFDNNETATNNAGGSPDGGGDSSGSGSGDSDSDSDSGSDDDADDDDAGDATGRINPNAPINQPDYDRQLVANGGYPFVSGQGIAPPRQCQADGCSANPRTPWTAPSRYGPHASHDPAYNPQCRYDGCPGSRGPNQGVVKPERTPVYDPAKDPKCQHDGCAGGRGPNQGIVKPEPKATPPETNPRAKEVRPAAETKDQRDKEPARR